MSFWNSIAAMADNNPDDDSADFSLGNKYVDGMDNSIFGLASSSLDEMAEKARKDTLDVLVNLPTGKIEARHNACETCGNVAILGNGLCRQCWDYVVDNSSANAKLWPDASQYLTIKAKKGGVN